MTGPPSEDKVLRSDLGFRWDPESSLSSESALPARVRLDLLESRILFCIGSSRDFVRGGNEPSIDLIRGGILLSLDLARGGMLLSLERLGIVLSLDLVVAGMEESLDLVRLDLSREYWRPGSLCFLEELSSCGPDLDLWSPLELRLDCRVGSLPSAWWLLVLSFILERRL